MTAVLGLQTFGFLPEVSREKQPEQKKVVPPPSADFKRISSYLHSAIEDANDLLIRAGFIRQAYSGVFHMLPLGLRVENKLEALIDKHMQSIGMLG